LEEVMCSTQAIKCQWGSVLMGISYDIDHQLGGNVSGTREGLYFVDNFLRFDHMR